MKILGLDSSGLVASVAVVEDDRLLAEYTTDYKKTHSQTLLPMLDELKKMIELDCSTLDAIAISSGPGSFTGIRIGVSTVKGLAWAAEKPCVGVSTLEAMAWHGLAVGGYICPVMDARRSQVYNALFKIENGRPVRMTEDRPIALEELAKEVTALGAPVFLIGDGAALCFEYFTAHGVPCVMAPDNLRWQDAWGVAMAAADKTPGNADELLPVYLRLSQAERERQERLSQSVNS